MYSIWTTTYCNLKCTYCYEGQEKNRIYMDRKTADQVIEFIKNDFDDEELIINFHGGEPFLNFEIIRYMVEKIEQQFSDTVIQFTATTNATVLTDEIVDFITYHHFGLTVSIDGTKQSHNHTRKYQNGKGTYEIVRKTVEKLLSKDRSLRIRMTITPDNVRELYENVLNIVALGLTTIVPAIDSYDNRWSEEDFDVLKEKIGKLRNMLAKDITLSLFEPLTYCGQFCTGGYVSKHIYCNGDIYPCGISCGNDEFKIGDIYIGIDKQKLDSLYEYGYKECKDCKGCDLKMYCEATRCKILNKIKTGSFVTPSAVDCNFTNVLYELNGVG